MPKRYASFLKAAVHNDNSFMRGEARDMMIKYFGYEGKQLPPDFPSLDQVKRRVTTVQSAQKKAVAAETAYASGVTTIYSSSAANGSVMTPSKK